MKIGLIDVDGHGFPNLALMKLSSYHKSIGDSIGWADMENYDRTYTSKIFSFSPEFEPGFFNPGEIIRGGTGYDIKGTLPDYIESCNPDYSIYPQYNFSIQFFSRGCIRKCPFCLVNEKEGRIRPVEPMSLNPKGEWIEVLDNNFFANPEWRKSVEWLLKKKQKVNLHGVDIRIMNEEQAFWLNKLNLKQNIHIAWDLPQIDLSDRLKEFTKYVKSYKITCYVLVGFNSTIEEDLYRLNTLKSLGITPFVQPYRDFENMRKPTNYETDLARWANRMWLFRSMDFADYSPRKGFKCSQYFS